MVCKNRGIYRAFGLSWVPITMPSRKIVSSSPPHQAPDKTLLVGSHYESNTMTQECNLRSAKR